MDGLLDKFNQQTRQLQEAQEAAASATATVTSADGLVTATVDSAGSLVDLEFAAASFQRSDPKRLARTAADTVRRASAQVQQRLTELMSPITEGMPDLADLVEGAPSLKGLVPTLPEPPEPAAPEQGTSPGERSPATPPAQQRAKPRRPVVDDDDDDGQRSWLLPGGR
ncbi:YbaB/EbfC family nucleoid-associated protein [Saccharopolyspora gloriosae]|uniref:YbaB/EbfC family nucleoid-associated protein n=1 Tax=Saccharopolyspora gloriosae TaxID=455344 RepID=UPI001FB6BFA1|nr:YbaB/EbfC family nucleoid-associated protein [Saccharopolyspora gloriosae]